MRAKRTESFGDVTRRIVERADPKGKRHGARVVDAWNLAAGPEIAKHTHGAALRDGTLIVYVDSAAWANELVLMTDRFLSVIRSETGKNLVKSIRFTVSKRVSEIHAEEQLAGETEEYYRSDEYPTEPLTENELSQAAHVAAAVHDETLREAALRVMIKDLEWKKAVRTRNTAETGTERPEGHILGS